MSGGLFKRACKLFCSVDSYTENYVHGGIFVLLEELKTVMYGIF